MAEVVGDIDLDSVIDRLLEGASSFSLALLLLRMLISFCP